MPYFLEGIANAHKSHSDARENLAQVLKKQQTRVVLSNRCCACTERSEIYGKNQELSMEKGYYPKGANRK